ncbi:uncharacterized protein EV420DRAFT_606927 [Desarmillaria tabescens]|uniref:Secreted protein n=1 Tax=Armillaria tabescens TaxID=1929756 RepID=A0AA39K6S5_ARMTA|nr:uncharacterized protein EV420DRAFT_606927 [Desarmillaria tabescens]KAK0454269.1 hypothetical protein EV420DRAFT_606927 [Desarmillaria tabescens]
MKIGFVVKSSALLVILWNFRSIDAVRVSIETPVAEIGLFWRSCKSLPSRVSGTICSLLWTTLPAPLASLVADTRFAREFCYLWSQA